MAAASSLTASHAILTPATNLRFTSISGRVLRLPTQRPRAALRRGVRAAAVEALEGTAATATLVDKSVNTIRFLAIDAVEKANSGHPGLPMGCAPMGHILYDEVMRYNPSNPYWFNRDRFVLSAGHGCMLQYALLQLVGYDSVKCVPASYRFVGYIRRMMASLSLLETGHWFSTKEREGQKAKTPPTLTDKLHLKGADTRASSENLCTRRLATLSVGATWVSTSAISRCLIPLPVKAEELAKDQADGGDNGVLGAINTLFDPDEKTKSGKVLPKAYLKAAREVVKTLRESLEGDTSDNAKFRRSADAAKESIREYLNGWRGQKAVVAEESYAAIEKAIRSLASFYSKAGPFASMSKEVKSSILDDLNIAEASL